MLFTVTFAPLGWPFRHFTGNTSLPTVLGAFRHITIVCLPTRLISYCPLVESTAFFVA